MYVVSFDVSENQLNYAVEEMMKNENVYEREWDKSKKIFNILCETGVEG